MLNKQCTALPSIYCCLFASKKVFSAILTDFEFAWPWIIDCVKSKEKKELPNEPFCQVCSLNFNDKILSGQLIKSLTKDRDRVVTSPYRFRNRSVLLGLHLTINDCTSVRLFAYTSEKDKKDS